MARKMEKENFDIQMVINMKEKLRSKISRGREREF